MPGEKGQWGGEWRELKLTDEQARDPGTCPQGCSLDRFNFTSVVQVFKDEYGQPDYAVRSPRCKNEISMNTGWRRSAETCRTGRMNFQTEANSQIKTSNNVFKIKSSTSIHNKGTVYCFKVK